MELLRDAAAERLGVPLNAEQLDRFRRYHLEIADWSSRVNLTTVTGLEEVQYRHFLDSLSVITVLPPALLASGVRVLDVGSGAGLPGLPLKIAFPTLTVTLLEATAKKTAFLAHVCRLLGLHDVDVITGRAEALAHDPGHRESYDLVLSRAIGRLPVVAELTLAFCRLDGVVVAHKTWAGIKEEVRSASRAIELMGGRLGKVEQIARRGLDGGGALVVLDKADTTPDRYPRRPGVPARRPL